jgi:hypothetical protein
MASLTEITMTTSRKRGGPAPSTRLRNGIFEACGQQPEHAGNLWLAYSTRNKQQWAINGDLRFLHFLYLEFAPDVVRFQIRPTVIAQTAGAFSEITFDAVVQFVDGHAECRDVVTETASDDAGQVAATSECIPECISEPYGSRRVRIGLSDLEPFRQRIVNGLRMNRFLTAARYEPMEHHCNEVLMALKGQGGCLTLAALVQRSNPLHGAFAQAAVFRLYQQRHVEMDLDAGPIDRHAAVRLPS